MKATLTTLSLALVSLCAQATLLPDVQLKYEYFEKGISICSGEKRVSYGDQFLLSDRTVAGTRILLKATVTSGSNDGFIKAEIDHIDNNGKMMPVSRPTIAFMSGEQVSIAQGTENEEGLRLEATATFLKSK